MDEVTKWIESHKMFEKEFEKTQKPYVQSWIKGVRELCEIFFNAGIIEGERRAMEEQKEEEKSQII